MSIKDLFYNIPKKILASKTLEEMGNEVESERYLQEKLIDKDRFIPEIDYSNPSEFVRFGSAEEYYGTSIQRIYKTFPYDGSRYEKSAWINSSSYLDLYVFEHWYPRTTGYGIISAHPDGWGTFRSNVDKYGESSLPEYIYFKGGPHADPDKDNIKDAFPDIVKRMSGSRGANLYDLPKNRESNLKIDGADGNTVEFWLKKRTWTGAQVNANAKREVVFDAYTITGSSGCEALKGVNTLGRNRCSGSTEYGRLRVEMIYEDSDDIDATKTRSGGPFRVTYMSGTNGLFDVPMGSGLTLAQIADDKWHHYTFTFKNTGSLGITEHPTPIDTLQDDKKAVKAELYVDGQLYNTVITGSTVDYVSGSIVATLGSLVAAPSGSDPSDANEPTIGWGKLSASIDEFRFWKYKRTAEEIGRFFRQPVGAGSNIDDANTQLGVYFKFNEGVTGKTSTDSVVLDYSGRISNGEWTGYTSTSRATGSAMVESKAADYEFKDPILYHYHSDVSKLYSDKTKLGKEYDISNPGSFYHSFPEWILSEDSESGQNLLKLTQILSSYFDTLTIQMKALPRLKDMGYVSGSHSGSLRPLPFADRLLEHKGFNTSDLFADGELIEHFLDRDETEIYRKDINVVKNLIYENIYNNLDAIYKSKGTEKSFRNLIRCFGVDDELVNVNVYTNNADLEIKDKYRETVHKKKYADFSRTDNHGAIVYQHSASNDVTVPFYRQTRSFISGSSGSQGDDFLENGIGQTYECEVILPKQFDIQGSRFHFYNSLTSSIFGVHTAADVRGIETSFSDANVVDNANFQVYVVRDKALSDHAYFMLKSENASVVPTLTSSVFYHTYDNQKWNLAVKIKPVKHPWSDTVSGSSKVHPTGSITEASLIGTTSYTVEFYGVNMVSNIAQNQFYLTSSLGAAISEDRGDDFLKQSKRLYVGSHRTNMTGTLLAPSDVKVSSARVWMDYLENEVIDAHARDAANFGTLYPYESAYLFESSGSKPDSQLLLSQNANFGTFMSKAWQGNIRRVPQIETLALHWDFSQVTGSNAGGKFDVVDASSGSADTTTQAFTTFTVDDGDAASGMTEKEYIIITSTDYTTRRYVITDADKDGSTATGTVLVNGTTDTGAGTAGADEAGGIAVSIDLTGTAVTQNAFLVQLKAAIEHANGHNGKITVSSVPSEDNGNQSITLTQAGKGPAGNTVLNTAVHKNISQLTVANFVGGHSAPGKYGWIDRVIDRQHPGRGEFFEASSETVTDTVYLHSSKQLPPENVSSYDMINILDRDDEQFVRETRPLNFYFAVEKSMYQTISAEMLNFFATIKHFSDLIGDPVNRYRQEYKAMEKLRQLFFERIKNTPDVDKYVEYYRWIDSSIGEMIQQLFPASAAHSEGLRTLVESHVLERNKYWNKYPTLDQLNRTSDMGHRLNPTSQTPIPAEPEYTGKTTFPDVLPPAPGTRNSTFGTAASFVTAPVPDSGDSPSEQEAQDDPDVDQRNHIWFARQAERDKTPAISSGDATVDSNREDLRRIIVGATNAGTTATPGGPHGFQVKLLGEGTYHLGSNANVHTPSTVQNRVFWTHLSASGLTSVKLMTGSIELKLLEEPNILNPKVRLNPEIIYETSANIEPVDMQKALDGFVSVYSSSLGIKFTNIHQDISYGIEATLQGPYTRENVGGYEHRKQPIASGSVEDTILRRPERFRVSAPASVLATTVAASLANAIDVTGVANDHAFTLTSPVAMGGDGVTYTFKFVAGLNEINAGASGNVYYISRHSDAGGTVPLTTAQKATATANAINAVTSPYVAFSDGNAASVNSTDLAITADGSAGDGTINLTWNQTGGHGNGHANVLAATNGFAGALILTTAFGGGGGVNINIYPPHSDLSGNLNLNLPRADVNRGTKRPISIKNILLTTGSLERTKIGNYQKTYQLVQTSGRRNNNHWFVHNSSSVATYPEKIMGNRSIDLKKSTSVKDWNDDTLPTRTKKDYVFVERFSAPGGFEVMSRGYLDPQSEEYSIYNALPWRNWLILNSSGSMNANNSTLNTHLGITAQIHATGSSAYSSKHDGLNVLLTRHCGKFGTDRVFGSVSSANYETTASYHKTHRNTRRVLKYSGASIITASLHDNYWVQHPIPRSEIQYAWITSSIDKFRQDLIGYASHHRHYDGQVSGAVEYLPLIKFFNGSEQTHGGVTSDAIGLNTLVVNTLIPETNTVSASANYSNLDLVSEAEFPIPNRLNILLKNRNGTYQGASWKLSNKSNHPIVRYQRRNNIFDILKAKKIQAAVTPEDVFKSEKDSVMGSVYDNEIKKYTMTPITNKYGSIIQECTFMPGTPASQEYIIEHSYANDIEFMPVDDLDFELGLLKKIDSKIEKSSYVEWTGTLLDPEENLLLNKITYSETIVPREEHTFLAKVRGRTLFSESQGDIDNKIHGQHRTFWRDSLNDRQRTSRVALNSQGFRQDMGTGFGHSTLGSYFNGPNYYYSPGLSIWPLDGSYMSGSTRSFLTGAKEQFGTYDKIVNGELLASSERSILAATLETGIIGAGDSYYNAPATASQQYLYPNKLYHASSDANDNLTEPARSWRFILHDFYKTSPDAGKNPWYDSYEDYAQDIRVLAKDHAVIPEFRISEHMDHYIDNGFSFNNKFLTLEGATISGSAVSETGSYSEDFFKIYSHSDFIKHFGRIKEDYTGEVELSRITLSCHGIKKFLPYQGLYPVLRCVQLGTMFSQSFGPHIGGSSAALTGSYEAERLQSLLQPFYAPGIMYNTIKAGIAVDWPVVTGSLGTATAAGVLATRYLSGSLTAEGDGGLFNFRVPFEAIVEPERYIPITGAKGEKSKIAFIYPHLESGATLPTVYFSWKGQSSIKYNLAANNFLAEASNFFLKDGLTTFSSKPESQFKSMKSGSTYYMDVELYKTDKLVMTEGPTLVRTVEATGYKKQAGMAGSIYGPPVQIFKTGDVRNHAGVVLRNTLNIYDPAYAPYTPPYLYGSAIARISFSPHDFEELLGGESRVYTLDEILAGAKMKTVYTSSYTEETNLLYISEKLGHPAGVGQMRLSASINLFGKTRLKEVSYGTILDEEGKYIPVGVKDSIDSALDTWTISTKFETPILNFYGSPKRNLNTIKAHHDSGVSTVLTGSVMTRGMWGSYGSAPTGSEGVYLKIKESFADDILSNSPTVGSIIDVCGFEANQRRVGELLDTKVISEAIVAIPFIQMEGKRQFFSVLRSQIDYAIGTPTEEQISELEETGKVPADSIKKMVKALRKYVMPPHMDFLTDKAIDPYVVYVFEFEHKLDRNDLADMWQNLLPDNGINAEEQTVTISHPIAQNELFGGNNIPNETQWMVFKIKRKAKKSYFETTADSQDDARFAFQFQVGGVKKVPDYSYNWPYDFFSLVELAKINAEVEFTKI